MNYIDAYVEEVLGYTPYVNSEGKLFILVEVKYIAEGVRGETRLMFEPQSLIRIEKGYKFMT